MIDWAAWLEATALAGHLKSSRWTYPLVNAGHILGVALLVGAVVAMDLRLLGVTRGPSMRQAVHLLRPVAAAGLVLAAACGVLLFATQAQDYVDNGWFLTKIALVAAGVASVALHWRLDRPRRAALISIAVWPAALVAGRMIGYS